MRFFVKCDICGKEFKCEKMKLPSEIMLIEGMDLCKRCRFKYHKRKMKLLDELSKEMVQPRRITNEKIIVKKGLRKKAQSRSKMPSEVKE